MQDDRPNPFDLLKNLSVEEEQKKRGKLKIFFGYAAGVGKTYAMLEAAQALNAAGVDVVAGYIEPHARPETLALLDGLATLPPLEIQYKGITLKEFDLDAAIARKPAVILVDELAHTNAEGCRHLKRYQDIEELLDKGISVYTTVNVQHIESLNDIVASITGVIVGERIPDSVFDSADQVELVDIEPDDLILRLGEGKIYRSKQAEKALHNFFTRDNLVALREIALRRTADRVNRQTEKSKQTARGADYYTEEHILICLSSSPSNAKVIRTAARMATAFHGAFTALFVETPRTSELTDENRERLRKNLKLAEQLGARIATIYGEDVPEQIAEYAKLSGVSKIVMGRPGHRRRGVLARTSVVNRLTELAPGTDIYIIPDDTPGERRPKIYNRVREKLSFSDMAKTLAIFTATTLLGLWFYELGFSEANIIALYILCVLVTSLLTRGRTYSLVISIAGVLIFNFLFTEPRFSLEAYDSGYPVTFLIMFLAAFIASTLATGMKKQARQAALKAHRTEVLLEMNQILQRAGDRQQILKETAHQMSRLLDRSVILYPGGEGSLLEPIVFEGSGGPIEEDYLDPAERAVAEWSYENNKHAGATTATLPGAKCLYLAVRSRDLVFAVVAVPISADTEPDAFQKNLLLALLAECGLALEKEQLYETRNEIAMKAKQEQLRANLLRAISHDLRTPLTSISGNAGVLMENSSVLDDTKKQQLYTDIYDDSMWLISLVENLLSVTRLENGSMNIKMEPELISDVIDESMRHLNRKAAEHVVEVHLPEEMLLAKMDSRLIVQVILNIMDNAVKYTKKGSHITVSAMRADDEIAVEIADDGPGIPEEDKERLFDMFFTSGQTTPDGRRGMGLGLSLCKSIIDAHGGKLTVRDNTPSGTVFRFTLPGEEIETNEQ